MNITKKFFSNDLLHLFTSRYGGYALDDGFISWKATEWSPAASVSRRDARKVQFMIFYRYWGWERSTGDRQLHLSREQYSCVTLLQLQAFSAVLSNVGTFKIAFHFFFCDYKANSFILSMAHLTAVFWSFTSWFASSPFSHQSPWYYSN